MSNPAVSCVIMHVMNASLVFAVRLKPGYRHLLAWAVLLTAILPHPASARMGTWEEAYLDYAEAEAVYGTAADEISPEEAGKLLLNLVNEARLLEGLDGLEWSVPAARSAADHAAEMALYGYASHYNQDGTKCELRFNLLGGTDHVSENVSGYRINRPVHLTPQLVNRMHGHWMDSPGHRANILDPAHTHLGCAFVVKRSVAETFAAGAVEFVNDYGNCDRLPLRQFIDERIRISGTLDPARATLLYIGIGTEAWPEPVSLKELRKLSGGYRQPKVTVALLPRQYHGVVDAPCDFDRYTLRYDPRTGEYGAELHLDPIWPAAAYYVTVWAVGNGGEALEPDSLALQQKGFRVMTQVVLVE